MDEFSNFYSVVQDKVCSKGQMLLEIYRLPVKALLLINDAPSHPGSKELASWDGSIKTMFLYTQQYYKPDTAYVWIK